jgi:nitrite reductase/ring-hydroxylating ferredoxin subunit
LSLVNKTFRSFSSLLLGSFLIVLGCGKTPLQRNPYLVDLRFQRELNLSLPLYNSLNFVGGSILLRDLGINGVIVFNLNGTTFLAWEATCPNHLPKACSALSITGVLAECSCEQFQYSLATGQLLNPTEALNPPQGLLFYQVQNFNGTLRITN